MVGHAPSPPQGVLTELLAGDRWIDSTLVERLVASQFSHWAHLSVSPVAESGWDHRMFRLGASMSVRMPSAAHYAAQVQKEQRWLPYLAQHLPLPIPTPLAAGEPGPEYPWPWSIYNWLEGETANHQRVPDPQAFAAQLAHFLRALQRIDTDGAPPPGEHNFHRGGELIVYDHETRSAVAALDRGIDGAAVLNVWEAALATRWQDRPLWVHGDIAPGNLLVRDGRLSAVIDFGGCAVGDPACDLAIAWTFFDAPARRSFKARLDVDDGTWLRSAGWALWKALIGWARTPHAPPDVEHPSRRTVESILADFKL